MMTNNIKKAVNNTKTIAKIALLTMAQLSLADGFNDLNSTATKIRAGLYTFVGILFSITLLWAFFAAKNGQKTWYNILVECLYIVGGGASIGFVAFLFATGGKMSF